MKFKIYKEQSEPVEKPVNLMLKQVGSEIRLVAVNENGKTLDAGNILAITSDGTLLRHPSVEVDGIQTNEYTKIKETKGLK